MASTQQYSLKWNNHQPNFISTFANLLNNKMLVDVTLSAEGKQIGAHKIVLSACSPYFQSLFLENAAQYPIIILKDVSYADLTTLVNFMYYGEVNVTQQQLPKVLETAKMLKIKGLTENSDTSSLPCSQAGTSDNTTQEVESLGQQSESPVVPMSPNTRRKRRRKTSSATVNHIQNVEDEPNEDGSPGMNLQHQVMIHDVTTPPPPETDDEIQVPLVPHQVNRESVPINNDVSQETTRPCSLQLMRTPVTLRLRNQTSEPGPEPRQLRSSVRITLSEPTSPLQNASQQSLEPEDPGQVMIRAVSVIGRQVSATVTSSPTLFAAELSTAQRASHTPAVRSGPPLSCNFCWNTVDESGRILRRKTQYHCPECRTNLCIVPCFHEYHEDPEHEDVANAC